ncbi:MAG: hypothetical protein U1F11_05130 [Steroidobacteraceae bacterium]
MAAQELLGEGLRTLELRGRPARASSAGRGFEDVHDADQRCLGSDDGERDLLGARQRHEAGDVVGRDRDVAHARLARRCRHCQARPAPR